MKLSVTSVKSHTWASFILLLCNNAGTANLKHAIKCFQHGIWETKTKYYEVRQNMWIYANFFFSIKHLIEFVNSLNVDPISCQIKRRLGENKKEKHQYK